MCSQSCPTLYGPMDCSPPGSSDHGILWARILDWAAISFSRDLPHPGIKPGCLKSPALAGGILTTQSLGKPHGEGGPHPNCWDPESNKELSEGGVSAWPSSSRDTGLQWQTCTQDGVGSTGSPALRRHGWSGTVPEALLGIQPPTEDRDFVGLQPHKPRGFLMISLSVSLPPSLLPSLSLSAPTPMYISLKSLIVSLENPD